MDADGDAFVVQISHSVKIAIGKHFIIPRNADIRNHHDTQWMRISWRARASGANVEPLVTHVRDIYKLPQIYSEQRHAAGFNAMQRLKHQELTKHAK